MRFDTDGALREALRVSVPPFSFSRVRARVRRGYLREATRRGARGALIALLLAGGLLATAAPQPFEPVHQVDARVSPAPAPAVT